MSEIEEKLEKMQKLLEKIDSQYTAQRLRNQQMGINMVSMQNKILKRMEEIHGLLTRER